MSAIAKIEVTVSPTEGGTLAEGEPIAGLNGGTYWRAIRNDTRESIIVTAEDVAWVLANPVLAMSGSRGYGRVRIGLRENAAIASAQDYESGRRRTAPSGDLKSLADIDGDRWIAAAVQAFSNATHDRT